MHGTLPQHHHQQPQASILHHAATTFEEAEPSSMSSMGSLRTKRKRGARSLGGGGGGGGGVATLLLFACCCCSAAYAFFIPDHSAPRVPIAAAARRNPCVLGATKTTTTPIARRTLSPVRTTAPPSSRNDRFLALPMQSSSHEPDDASLVASSSSTASVSGRRGKILSSDEQRELLRQVAEMRRIQAMQKEMAMRTPNLQPPSTLALAKACGYQDDDDGAAAQVDAAIKRGHVARETLVTANMGLVHHVVKTVVGSKTKSLAVDDMVQEGAIGLARAVDRWNPEVGGKFSTYAYYWIRAGVLRGIAQRDELVRVPEHVRTVINKLERAASALGVADNNGNSAFSDWRWREAKAAKELAEAAGVTPQQVEQAWHVQERRRNMMSLEAWQEQGKDVSAATADDPTTPISLSRDSSTNNNSPMASIELEDLRPTLAKFLRPRELEALSWRYGLINDHDEDNKAVTESPKKKKSGPRNYVEEAERELFGSVRTDDSPSSRRPQPQLLPAQGRWGEAMSFDEVGKRMQVSAEYGRRLCHGALEKLRRAAQEGSLREPAFNF